MQKPSDILPFGSAPRVLKIVDAYGRILQEGDEIIGHQMEIKAPRFVMQEIKPVLDPKAPPGMVQVILQHTIGILVPADKAIPDFIRTRKAEEMKPLTEKISPVVE